MEKTIEIPEGYAARIEGNKVILELKESEDERVRKEIIKFINWAVSRGSVRNDWLQKKSPAEWIAYLERQKEQKPAEDKDAIEPTPKQDYSGLTDFERAIHRGFLCAGVENVPVDIIKDTAQDCLAQIKPAEWRPIDDEYMFKLCEVIDEYEAERVWKESIKRWLKSLRPSWKPSEEQRHIEGQDTCYLNKQKLVNFIEDRIAENLENTTQENRDNHEGYHQACWNILYFIKQASK